MMYGQCVPWYTCGGQRTTFQKWVLLFHIKRIITFILCIWVFSCIYASAHHVCAVPEEARRGHQIPLQVKGGWNSSCGCWQLNPHTVLLTTAPSLQFLPLTILKAESLFLSLPCYFCYIHQPMSFQVILTSLCLISLEERCHHSHTAQHHLRILHDFQGWSTGHQVCTSHQASHKSRDSSHWISHKF